MSDDAAFAERMRKIEELVAQIERIADPQLRGSTVELVSLLMELNGQGFARVLEMLWGQGDERSVEQLGADPLVGNLLMLYGIHPEDLETRIGRALDKVRPLLASHGGNVELLSVHEGHVALRLIGSCHGCPSSAQTLKNAIEEAIYEFAADIVDLQVEGAVVEGRPLPQGFVSLEQLA